MASSRKPAPRADPSPRLTAKVAQALQGGAAFVVSGGSAGRGATIAVALSGGRDSVALLHATRAAVQAAALPARVVALHVHHGLQDAADGWDDFCRDLCQSWDIGYFTRRVSVLPHAGEGVEASARRARYGALAAMCDDAGAGLLLFAHHLDDQVETVLLRLLRGTGVAGMAGMPAMRRLDGDSPVMLLRPWLDVGREDIDAYCAAHALPWIDDPSNKDPRYARNALRHHMPALLAAFPALRANVAQAAAHFAQAGHMLDGLAARELSTLVRPGRDADTLAELDLAGLRALPPGHAANVLRMWLRDLGARAPSTGRLEAMLAQLVARDGGEPAIAHDGLILRRFRDSVLACRDVAGGVPGVIALTWHGEAVIDVPAWRGSLHFDRDDTLGIPEPILRQSLRLAPRQGGERIVLRPGGPARALKQAYQEAGVPAWRRAILPLLWAGDHLVLAAGLGMNRRWPGEHDRVPHAPRWRVAWAESDPSPSPVRS